jgi:GMP synthase (glutamine-hydrolysing)
MTRDVIAIRHVAFEDLGLLAPILAARGLAVRYVEATDDGLASLDPLAPALMVVLGGPIGVYEADDYPFIRDELRLIRARLDAGKPIIGICLGAQLMAAALGARVYPGHGKELGWAPLGLSEAGQAHAIRHLAPALTSVLHWHGDTFDLPPGATRLASSALYDNQAFAYGRNALALQFHAEAAGQALERWLVGHALEIAKTDGVSVSGLREATRRNSPAMITQGGLFFNTLLDDMGLST